MKKIILTFLISLFWIAGLYLGLLAFLKLNPLAQNSLPSTQQPRNQTINPNDQADNLLESRQEFIDQMNNIERDTLPPGQKDIFSWLKNLIASRKSAANQDKHSAKNTMTLNRDTEDQDQKAKDLWRRQKQLMDERERKVRMNERGR